MKKTPKKSIYQEYQERFDPYFVTSSTDKAATFTISYTPSVRTLEAVEIEGFRDGNHKIVTNNPR